MRIIRLVVLGTILLSCKLATADVVNAEESGFKVVNKVFVDASREDAWRAAILEVDKWWSSDHTVSGEASRLRIDAKPQGCFCEDLGKSAGVVHMAVTMVFPPNVLRLTGGLGPLGLMGVEGNMTWEFDDVAGDTQITFTYAVGGFRPDGLGAMAEPVDNVIDDALKRLQAYIDTGDAEYSDID
ncbi:MAG: SRPBCC domain-containing protein [Woeseiaceae bacterium]